MPEKHADFRIAKKAAQICCHSPVSVEKVPTCDTEGKIPWRVTHPAIRQCHCTVQIRERRPHTGQRPLRKEHSLQQRQRGFIPYTDLLLAITTNTQLRQPCGPL